MFWFCLVSLCAIIIGLLLLWKIRHPKEGYTDELDTPTDLQCNIDKSKVKEGLAYFKKQRVIICGLVRDSVSTIALVRKKAEMLGALFADYAILAVENDSTDGTRNELINWQKVNDRVTVLGCEVNAPKCGLGLKPTIVHDRNLNRIEKMVKLRNVYLDYIKANSKLREFEFTLVWDFDIDGVFYRDGVGMSGYFFKNGSEMTGEIVVNAICANGASGVRLSGFYNPNPVSSATYYDPYAHKEIGERPEQVSDSENLKPENCSSVTDMRAVQSCFNGLMFYRTSVLRTRQYSLEKDDDGNAICEHVALHRDISGVYINPFMLFVIVPDPAWENKH